MNNAHHFQTTLLGCLFGIVGMLVIFLNNQAVHAATKCYDFSGPDIGKTYEEGATVDAKHSVIHLQKFRTSHGPSEYPQQLAQISPGNHAQAEAPSLRITSVVAQVRPKQGVRKVTLKYAEATGGAYVQNFGVNGERLVLEGGLAQINGRELGRSQFGGKANVVVTANPVTGWVRGTVEVTADKGSLINVIAIGGHSQFYIDDFCITE